MRPSTSMILDQPGVYLIVPPLLLIMAPDVQNTNLAWLPKLNLISTTSQRTL